MEYVQSYFVALWDVILEASPWLLLGLVAAGLIKALVPADWMSKWMGKPGLGSVVRAAVIGTPLPLCSCGVLPAAMGLHRAGASRGSTVSFLVATPENGADSIAMTYALLGPFMTIVRPVAALFSAIIAGLLAEVFPQVVHPALAGDAEPARSSCCGSKKEPEVATPQAGSCCGSKKQDEPKKPCCGSTKDAPEKPGWVRRAAAGLHYSSTRIIDDISVWLIIGLAAAAAITAFVPHSFLETWGAGVTGLFVMLIVGLPMYICATASTPVAASLLLGGVSPGAVLVFLLAGPATNIGSIMVVKRELGKWSAAGYLIGVCGGALAFGFATNVIAGAWDINFAQQAEHAHRMIPQWVQIASAAVLIFIAIPPLRRLAFRDSREQRIGAEAATAG